jgi:hypothetical protein
LAVDVLFFFALGFFGWSIEAFVVNELNLTEVFEVLGRNACSASLTDFLAWLFYLDFFPLILLSFKRLTECLAVLGCTAFFESTYF